MCYLLRKNWEFNLQSIFRYSPTPIALTGKRPIYTVYNTPLRWHAFSAQYRVSYMGAQTLTARAVCPHVAIALSLFLTLSSRIPYSSPYTHSHTHIQRAPSLSLPRTRHPYNSSHLRTHSHNSAVRPFLRRPPPLFAHTRACVHTRRFYFSRLKRVARPRWVFLESLTYR